MYSHHTVLLYILTEYITHSHVFFFLLTFVQQHDHLLKHFCEVHVVITVLLEKKDHIKIKKGFKISKLFLNHF